MKPPYSPIWFTCDSRIADGWIDGGRGKFQCDFFTFLKYLLLPQTRGLPFNNFNIYLKKVRRRHSIKRYIKCSMNSLQEKTKVKKIFYRNFLFYIFNCIYLLFIHFCYLFLYFLFWATENRSISLLLLLLYLDTKELTIFRNRSPTIRSKAV